MTIDLNKKQTLGNTTFFITEEAKETILDLSQGTVRVSVTN